MLKRVIRKAVREFMRFAEFPPTPKVWGNFNNEDFAYARLNNELDRLMAEHHHVIRANYTWSLLQATHLAKVLGYESISAVEFGVAGGNGLVAMEKAAELIEPIHGVKIEVHGFDTGEGLPAPKDYRDLPNLYAESDYKMDVPKLKARLTRAKLHLGEIADTLGPFLEASHAPVGFVGCDVDYYSSTVDCFKLFEGSYDSLLPRVHIYFDDIMGTSCCEFTGQRLAINEFNDAHAKRKIGEIPGLRYFLTPHFAAQQWSEMIYMLHAFDHPKYNQYDDLIVRAQDGHTKLKDGESGQSPQVVTKTESAKQFLDRSGSTSKKTDEQEAVRP